MITRDQLITVAHFNKAHGVNGEINVSLSIDLDAMQRLSCIVCELEGIYVPFFIKSLRKKGATTALMTIEDIINDNDAQMLVGRDVFALKRDYDKLVVEFDDEQVPLDYFLGFTITHHNATIGEIVGVDDATANVLFVVKSDKERLFYVPAVDQLIANIDLEKRHIDMDLPDGLLDL